MLIDDAHQIGQQTLPFVRREFPKSTVRAEFSHVDGLVSSIFRLDFSPLHIKPEKACGAQQQAPDDGDSESCYRCRSHPRKT